MDVRPHCNRRTSRVRDQGPADIETAIHAVPFVREILLSVCSISGKHTSLETSHTIHQCILHFPLKLRMEYDKIAIELN